MLFSAMGFFHQALFEHARNRRSRETTCELRHEVMITDLLHCGQDILLGALCFRSLSARDDRGK